MSGELNSPLAKSAGIAAHHREVLQWRGGSIHARSESNGEGRLYIYEQIGASWTGEGVTASGVKDALAALKGVKTLNIHINSEGGDVFEGKAIYAQLQRFEAQKVVRVDGIAASAASFIMCAGDKVVCAPEATVMIHNAWGMAAGDCAALRDYADLLDMETENIAAIYARKSGKPVAEFRALMNATTWLSAQKAVDLKLCDEVESFDARASASKPSPLAVAASSTAQVVAASTSALLEFRRKRADEARAAEEQSNNRASAGKSAAPARR